MKSFLSKTLISTTAIIGLGFALTGCSNNVEVSTLDDTAQIQYQYENFYEGLTEIKSEDATKVFNDLKELPDEPSETEQEKALDELKALAPKTFAAIDVTDLTLDQQIDTLAQYVIAGVLGNSSQQDMDYIVPEEAVTIDGNEASVDGSQVELKTNGKVTESDPVDLDFAKKDGIWLITIPAAEESPAPVETPAE